jgi:glycolate oxidase iron-sulfur subunit
MLTALGCELLPYAETHLCCGAAGTYSLTQPEIADALRERKLMHLGNAAPELILSTNVGCIAHLQAGTKTPVRHWIEWLDDNIKEICP